MNPVKNQDGISSHFLARENQKVILSKTHDSQKRSDPIVLFYTSNFNLNPIHREETK